MNASAAPRCRDERGVPARARPIPTRMCAPDRGWEDRGSMSVIARIPRLETGVDRGPLPSCAVQVAHDASGTSAASTEAPAPRGDRQPPPGGGRHRTSRRFPVATTLVLAATAAASWLAVWLQERWSDALDPAMTGAVAEVAEKDGAE